MGSNDSKLSSLSLQRGGYAYRNVQANGCVVPANEVPGLKVGVVSADVAPATAVDDFPVWGSFTSHPQITENLAGGLCPNDLTR